MPFYYTLYSPARAEIAVQSCMMYDLVELYAECIIICHVFYLPAARLVVVGGGGGGIKKGK